jgi:hypothetical protein
MFTAAIHRFLLYREVSQISHTSMVQLKKELNEDNDLARIRWSSAHECHKRAPAFELSHESEAYRMRCARTNRYGMIEAGSKPLMSGVATCRGRSHANVDPYSFGNLTRCRTWDEI